jgi:hypothetical protein
MPEPGVVGSVTLGLVPGRSLMPEPLMPEPLLPEPGVVGSVTLGLVPGRALMPEPLMPEPLLPEPGVVGLGALGPAPGRPLMPEPLVPEPLLPEPEVCASTKGAVTTTTARAPTTALLNLLNISLFSYSLRGCACWVALFKPCSPALPSAWEPYLLGKGAILMPQACAGQRALSGARMWPRILLF